MTIIIPPVAWGSIIFWICFRLFLTYCVFDPPKWLQEFYSGLWYIVWTYIQIAALYAALIFGLLGIGYVFSLDF